MAKKSDMIELQSDRETPRGLVPYTLIRRVQGRTCIDAFGCYWPLRAVVACLAAVVAVCLAARLLLAGR